MARMARIVIPGVPHHVVQRGNRRQRTFFSSGDRLLYLQLLKQGARQFGVDVWSYCLMDNHVHLVLVPPTESSLSDCMGWVHFNYSRRVNSRQGWTGFLWQGRYFSAPVGEDKVAAVVRYVERNPVRAGMVPRAEDFVWSSAAARVGGKPDPLLSRCCLTDEIRDWSSFLQSEDCRQASAELRARTRTGRPLGSPEFVAQLELRTGRRLLPSPPGRPKKGKTRDTRPIF
ncbi:MAG: transposase [Candidatus Wallbacteria bacterium]|nr:transposase [Candidatus Wallbacteria bacterium]